MLAAHITPLLTLTNETSIFGAAGRLNESTRHGYSPDLTCVPAHKYDRLVFKDHSTYFAAYPLVTSLASISRADIRLDGPLI